MLTLIATAQSSPQNGVLEAFWQALWLPLAAVSAPISLRLSPIGYFIQGLSGCYERQARHSTALEGLENYFRFPIPRETIVTRHEFDRNLDKSGKPFIHSLISKSDPTPNSAI